MTERIYTELCSQRAAKIIRGGKYEFENTFYDSVNAPVLSGSSFEIVLQK